MPHTTRNRPNPIALVRASEKFLNWNPSLSLEDLEEPFKLTPDGLEQSKVMGEQHYAPSDLAKMWGVSVQTVRELFKDEEGVLKLGSDGTRNRRAYKTLRIPHSVAERVHTRLSA
jgi:hypothetical protein